MILYTVSPSDTGIYIYNVDSSPVNSMFYIPMPTWFLWSIKNTLNLCQLKYISGRE